MQVIKEPRREFIHTSGLRKGYDTSALVHSKEEVLNIIRTWITERVTEGKPVVSGSLIPTDFIYPLEGSSQTEPAIRYQGNIRNEDSDKAEEILTDLGLHLAKQLGQKRVHCFYKDERWVIEL